MPLTWYPLPLSLSLSLSPNRAQTHDINFLETSAKEKLNVERSFMKIASQIMERMNAEGLHSAGGASTQKVQKLGAGTSIGGKSGGCC